MLNSEQEVQRLWNTAYKCRQESDLTSAITYYQKIRELRPQRTDVYCELASLYQRQQQPKQAIQAFQQAIKINPAQPAWVYQTLGKVLQEQQQDLAAIAAYEQGIKLNPQPPSWVYHGLGDLLVKQQKYQQAIAIYQKIIDLNQAQAASVQLKIGNIYQQQNKFFAAQAAYRQADIARAWYNINQVITCINKFWTTDDQVLEIDILDNGCEPTGSQLALLAEKTRGRVVGTNISAGFPQKTVKRRRHNNEFYYMDGQNLALDDCSFDLVVSLNVLEHVPNPAQYLDQCYRVMRPGGYGFFSWYPIWSGATGHHVHPDMVSNKAHQLGLKPPFYSLDGTSIPFWGHLLFSPSEMLDFLIEQQQYAPKLAEWMRDYIYYGNDLNRWLWRDVWRSFQAVNWQLVEVNHREKQPLDSQSINKLQQKYGFADNFQICGATIIVQK